MTQPEDETTEHPIYPAPPSTDQSGEAAGEPPAETPAAEPAPPAAEPAPPAPMAEPPAPMPEPAMPLPTEQEASEETEPWQAPAAGVVAAGAAWQQPSAAPQQPAAVPQQPPPPPQSAWQQPPGQQPAQQYGYAQQPYPQQQYPQQQYGYPQQPYPQQPYPGAYPAQQPYAGPEFGTSALVAFAGMLLVIFGIGVALIGAWALTQGPEIGRFIRENDVAIFNRQIDRQTLSSFLSPMPGVLMVIGLLQVIAGAGVFAHKGWARAIGILISAVGLLVSIFAVSTALARAPGLSLPMLISVVLLVGYAFVLLALFAGGVHFRRRYRAQR